MAGTRPRYDVFVSYSHADSVFVREWLIPRIEKRGLRVCLDVRDFEPGGKLLKEITDAILESRATILVVTNAYLNSEWAQFESVFSTHLLVTRQKRIIPLVAEKCQSPLLLEPFIHADFTQEEDREYQLTKVIGALKKDAPPDVAPVQEPTVRSHYRNFNVELIPTGGSQQYQLRAACPHIDAAVTQSITVRTAELHERAAAIHRGSGDRFVWQDIGRELYQIVFTPEVRDLWTRAEAASSLSDGRGVLRLRVKLTDRRLSTLPWELLHNDSFHLAMVLHYPVVRYSADVHMQRQGGPGDRPTILVADTGPKKKKESSRRKGDSDIDTLQAHLERLKSAGGIGDVRVLRSATLRQLQSALRSGSYDILHVLGECENRDGTDRLRFRNQRGKQHSVDGDMFGYLIRESPVRLLVLDVRSGAGIAEGANRAGVPAVVAMQGSVTRSAAAAFSEAFYDVLADGCPIEACMVEARKAIMTAEGLDSPQWAFPVVFNGDPDALMFRADPATYCFGVEVRGAAADSAPAAAAASGKSIPVQVHVKHNIPPAFEQHLIGRDDERRRVWAALEQGGVNNVVLLRSGPGLGKTAVARELAWEAVTGARYDSVTWISPSDSEPRDTADVLPAEPHRITSERILGAVSSVLGRANLHLVEALPQLRELVETLAYGRHLVVIDDVSVPAQDAVRAFIEAVPRTVQFVLTSPQRIGIGELEIEIGPLEAQDVRTLLPRAAKSVTAVAGGNPFVLRVESRRLDVLPGREIEAPQPASTTEYLRALLRILPNDMQRVLSVAVTLPYPSAVWVVRRASGLRNEAFDGAADRLLQLGLIEKSDEERLTLCSTLRSLFRDGEEADRRTLPDVGGACVGALAAVLIDANRESPDHDSPEFTKRVEPEIANMIWAARKAYATGRLHEVKTFRDLLHDTLYRLGSWSTAIELGDMAFLASSALNDIEGMAWAALYPLARIEYQRGAFRAAERWCATALAIFQAKENRTGMIAAKRYLGRIRQSEGDLDDARRIFTDTLKETRQSSTEPGQIGTATAALAALEQAAGNLNEAERLYRDALLHFDKKVPPDINSIGPTLHSLGRLQLAKGDSKAALMYLFRARDLLGRLRWRDRFARISHSIGLVYEHEQDFDAAARQFEVARTIFAALGANPELAESEAALVRARALRDHRLQSEAKR